MTSQILSQDEVDALLQGISSRFARNLRNGLFQLLRKNAECSAGAVKVEATVAGVPVLSCNDGVSNGKYDLKVDQLLASSTSSWIGEQHA